jgi:hypothetical protein
MLIVGPTGVMPTLKDGGACLIVGLDTCLVKVMVGLALQSGVMPTRVLGNDGMVWPWQADGGRFLSLSWVLAEEHVMAPLVMPTRMLGAEVLQQLTGECLLK